MSKLNINVGDEVYLKCTISRIEKRAHEDDYIIDVKFPDWFYDAAYKTKRDQTQTVLWSQHLLFTPEGEEA